MCLDCEHLSFEFVSFYVVFPWICASFLVAPSVQVWKIMQGKSVQHLLFAKSILNDRQIIAAFFFFFEGIEFWVSQLSWSKIWNAGLQSCFVLAGTCSLEGGNKLLKFTHVMIVVGIVRNMSNMGLMGTLPSELGELSYLEFLDLSNNRISGTIPSFFANLTYLANL